MLDGSRAIKVLPLTLGISVGAGVGVMLGGVLGAFAGGGSIGLWLAIGTSVGAGFGLVAGMVLDELLRPLPEEACVACGYPKEGLRSDRCPECGNAFAEPVGAGVG